MPVCSFCDSTFWLGGVKDGWRHFCNEECHQGGYLLHVAEQLPEDLVADHVYSTRRGNCPHCQGPGPVDAHASYRVWSALLVSETSNRRLICCRKCGRRAQISSTLFSALLGWWGIAIPLLSSLRSIAAVREAHEVGAGSSAYCKRTASTRRRRVPRDGIAHVPALEGCEGMAMLPVTIAFSWGRPVYVEAARTWW
jgi:hypothetical protein